MNLQAGASQFHQPTCFSSEAGTCVYDNVCSVVHYKLIKWAQSNLLSCFNVMFSIKMYDSASQNHVWAFPVISGMCTEQSPFVLDLLSRWCQCEDISLCGRKNVLEVCPMSIAHAWWENPRFGRFESGRVFQLDGGTAGGQKYSDQAMPNILKLTKMEFECCMFLWLLITKPGIRYSRYVQSRC